MPIVILVNIMLKWVEMNVKMSGMKMYIKITLILIIGSSNS